MKTFSKRSPKTIFSTRILSLCLSTKIMQIIRCMNNTVGNLTGVLPILNYHVACVYAICKYICLFRQSIAPLSSTRRQSSGE